MSVPEGVTAITAEFHVRYVETDAQGVVNHAHYVSWFEEARSFYSRERGRDYAEFEREGFFLAVAEVNVRYLRSARYGDRVAVRCWILELRSRSVVFGYEVRHALSGELLTTGQSKHICLNLQGQVTIIPEAWRNGMRG